jgi:hypothetical protein
VTPVVNPPWTGEKIASRTTLVVHQQQGDGHDKQSSLIAYSAWRVWFSLKLKPRYDNFIGGDWVAPVDGEYYSNLTPVTGQPLCEIASSGKRISIWRWMRHTR